MNQATETNKEEKTDTVPSVKKVRQDMSSSPKGRQKVSLMTRVGNHELIDATTVFLTDPVTGTRMGLYIKEVAPALAELLLLSNHDNQRGLKLYSIESYMLAMSSDLWSSSNGEFVKFNSRGELIDGQNRLTACVRSGETIYMMFIVGLPLDALKSIDNGVSRSLGDVLRVTGKTKYRLNTHSVAAFLRHYHYQKMMSQNKISESSARHSHRLCSIQAINLYDNMPDVDVMMERFTKDFGTRLLKRMPQSIALLMFYLFDGVDKEKTFVILKTLEQGSPFDELGTSSPAWAICQWITDRKMDGVRFNTNDYIGAFVWAFDKLHTGEGVKKYKPAWAGELGIEHEGVEKVHAIFDAIKY
jgi:hypothetical protein